MEAIGLTELGGPDVLRVVSMPTPEPGEGVVRIGVHTVAVNPTDATFRAGGRAAQVNAVAARLALDALGLSAGQAVAVTGAAGAVGGNAAQSPSHASAATGNVRLL